MIYSLRPLDICISPVGASKPQSRYCSFGKSDRTLHTNANALGRVRIKKPYPSNKRLLDTTCPIRCVSSRESASRDRRYMHTSTDRTFSSLRGFAVSRSTSLFFHLPHIRVLFQRRRVLNANWKVRLIYCAWSSHCVYGKKYFLRKKWTEKRGRERTRKRIFRNLSICHVNTKQFSWILQHSIWNLIFIHNTINKIYFWYLKIYFLWIKPIG